MRTIIALFIASFLFGCMNNEPAAKAKAENTTTIKNPAPSLAKFTDTLRKLNADTLTAIDSALHLYSVLAPDDSTGADSAAAALMGFIGKVVEKQNNHFINDSSDLSPLLDPAEHLTEKQRSINSVLHDNHLKTVSNGEGSVYLVPAYETILASIQSKTSAPVDRFLNLTAQEDTAASFKDAGLVIEITDFVDRLVESEQLLAQKLPPRFAAEAARLNKFYSNGLVRGADNTPALDNNTLQFTEQFRQGYDYLLAKYPSTKAAAKINVWVAVVKSGDKRKINDYLRLLP